MVIALVLVALAAPLVAPHDPLAQDVPNRLQGPSASHLLGTDSLGRDIFSRIIFGTRIAFKVALPTVGLAFLMGVALGLVAGYMGKRVDRVFLVVIDTIQAFPGIVLALAVIALMGPSLRNLIGVLAFTWIPAYARFTRGAVLAAKQRPFVESERSLGATGFRIAVRHVLPNVIAPILIMVSMDIPAIVTAEAGLSFLGLGVQPPTPSWGLVLNEGFARVNDSPWGILGAGAALVIATLGFTILGETLRDVLDPKAARRGGADG
jgi:peptide/nickel transport system permease protein